MKGNRVGDDNLYHGGGEYMKWIVTSLLMAATMATAMSGSTQAADQSGAEGIMAADFTVSTLSGETFQLDANAKRGKFILLNFWGLRCEACLQELPHLNAISKKYQGQVVVLGINVDGVDAGTLKDLMKEMEIHTDYTVVPDPQFVLVDMFKMKAAPLTLVIDPKKLIRYRHEGYGEGDEKELENILKRAIDQGKAGAD